MSDNPNEIIHCHITQREQIVMGHVLARVEAKGRAIREKKAAAFAALGLEWVRELIEEPAEESVSAEELTRLFEDALKIPGTMPVQAMGVSVKRLLATLDKFAGRHSREPIMVEVSRSVLEWVIDSLNNLEPVRDQAGRAMGGMDDLVLAEVEARFVAATNGRYQAPTAPDAKVLAAV
jgi:hypothetical protein